MIDCPICQGELSTVIDDGRIWKTCVNCGYRSMVISPDDHVAEDMTDELPSTPAPILLVRSSDNESIWLKAEAARRILNLAKANCISVSRKNDRDHHGEVCEVYEMDATPTEWAALISGAMA